MYSLRQILEFIMGILNCLSQVLKRISLIRIFNKTLPFPLILSHPSYLVTFSYYSVDIQLFPANVSFPRAAENELYS